MFSETVRMVWVRQYRGIGGLVTSIFSTSQPADELSCDEPDHPAGFTKLITQPIEQALRLPGKNGSTKTTGWFGSVSIAVL
jgi:hypothetical protein